MNKRGQFFLIAAVIIVTIIISFSTVVNSVRVGGGNKAFYDLSEEIGFETKQVLNYGLYNDKDTLSLTEFFLEQYADYIGQEQVVFIYGNADDLSGISYILNSPSGIIGITTGGISGTLTITSIRGEEAEVIELDLDNDDIIDTVIVEINDIDYTFRLKEGQNFFFVLIKGENEEKFVASG